MVHRQGRHAERATHARRGGKHGHGTWQRRHARPACRRRRPCHPGRHQGGILRHTRGLRRSGPHRPRRWREDSVRRSPGPCRSCIGRLALPSTQEPDAARFTRDARASCDHRHDRKRWRRRSRRAVVAGAAKAEHPTISRHQPVTPTVGCGRHANHRQVEPDATPASVPGYDSPAAERRRCHASWPRSPRAQSSGSVSHVQPGRQADRQAISTSASTRSSMATSVLSTGTPALSASSRYSSSIFRMASIPSAPMNLWV